MQQGVIRILQKSIEIKLCTTKHKVQVSSTAISKLLQLIYLMHVLLCHFVSHEFVVEMFGEEVVVGLLPDLQEGSLHPGGDDGLAVGGEFYFEVARGDEVLPLGFEPNVLHYLSFSYTFHVGIVGETEFVFEVVSEEGLLKVHMGLKELSRLAFDLFSRFCYKEG